jgi:hypothetical protein
VRGSPALGSDGLVLVGADDGRLYALDARTGATRWSYGTGGAITSAPAVGANGVIYVGSLDGSLYVLNRDGSLISSFRTGGAIDGSSPAIDANGMVYIGSRDGTLYALREGGPTPTAAPAATATPQPPAPPAAPPPAAPPAPPAPLPPSVVPLDRVDPLPDALYFFETGHNVRGAFLQFFTNNGGLAIFGYPRTEEIVENGRTVQYFQRARMEYFPEHAGTPYEVQLGLLGDELLRARGAPIP